MLPQGPYLLHLDEETVDEVARGVGVQGLLVLLRSLGNELYHVTEEVINLGVGAWEVLQDVGVDVVDLQRQKKGT